MIKLNRWDQKTTAYDKAKNPRELFIVLGATHMDMYDKPQFVSPAVARLKEFFEKNLK